ncbi:hypothetical protein Cri9333_1929 [Crinalium epipsammum PCC 9333]|uniref:Uncharacterized protein n=1 Tax=Crinalium epipsammum PCC 9333 TaxID=1173022 RepID=K9W062_9CYAN|nr:hypothetical protein [Crinalium epipsammum]AFZ12810.1 hypothetical protein Cri9333_1929 [Crinalium epipsammum PCC 9333]
MEQWSKDFFEMLDTVALMVDEFFHEVAESVETVAEEVQTTMSSDIEQFLHEIFEPIAEFYLELEDVVNEVDQPFDYTYIVEPTLDKNPACIGCQNYHGLVYNGNLLVCGMHPYGWDESNCPDWEESKINSSNSKDFF